MVNTPLTDLCPETIRNSPRFSSVPVAGHTIGTREFLQRESSMSPSKRGCQEKILPLPLPRGDGWWLASSRISVLERLWARRVFPDGPSSWRFVLDGFMTPWSFDAFGSGSYASKRIGRHLVWGADFREIDIRFRFERQAHQALRPIASGRLRDNSNRQTQTNPARARNAIFTHIKNPGGFRGNARSFLR